MFTQLIAAALLAGSASTVLAEPASIIAPVGWNQVGPAAVSNCGSDVAAYLSSNPGAALSDIQAAAGSASSNCNINICGGYQAADNVGTTFAVTWTHFFHIVVDYFVPANPGQHEAFRPIISVIDANNFTTLYSEDEYPGYLLPAVRNFTFISAQANQVYFKAPQTGVCQNEGECILSWQLEHQQATFDAAGHITGSTSTILNAACVGLTIDWTTPSTGG